MIHPIPRHSTRAVRLLGMLLATAALTGLPSEVEAEFRIGVWQPGGVLRADISFTSATVADLDELGIDLLINTPSQVGNQIQQPDHGRYQAFEERIMRQWSGSGPQGARGFVVQYAPEGHTSRIRGGYDWYLRRYAGSLCDPNLLHNPMSGRERTDLDQAVRLLESKWSAFDGFYGYLIGHEADPCGHGVYDSRTYANMLTVIEAIRAHDTTRRIVAVGNTQSTVAWTPAEQTAFSTHFFRPSSEPGPANVFMQEIYELHPDHDEEREVQDEIDEIVEGLDTIGEMVRTARNGGRRAEWHFIANVADQWHTNCTNHFRRDPSVSELNAQVYLALSRGATGITYFLYTSSNPNNCVEDYRYNGLVEYRDGTNQRARRTPHWNTVRTVNNNLRAIGNTLNPLTWREAFPSDLLSVTTLVDAVRPSADPAGAAGRLEFGVFHNDGADYVLAVNRDGLVSGNSQTIDLRFDTARMQSDAAGYGVYVVEEIVTDTRRTLVADANSHVWTSNEVLAAGEARLYQIERSGDLWAGRLGEDTSWTGDVQVIGDLTIPDGVTLTVAEGTQVSFSANSDAVGGGDDTARSELIVEGTLEASSAGITFRSSNSTNPGNDWYGIRVESGGTARLTGATVRDGVHCVKGDGTVEGEPELSNCGTAPTVTGPDGTEVGEEEKVTVGEVVGPVAPGTDGPTVATYTATDAEGDAVTWSLVDSGDDDAFAIDQEGVLAFRSPPNYEAPTATGKEGEDLPARNSYEVRVRAEDAQRAAVEFSVTAQVTNRDDPGVVTLSPDSPRIGETVTATLTDEDGDIVAAPGGAWYWRAVESGASASQDRSSATSTYTAWAGALGKRLEASPPAYSDGLGDGKRASGRTAGVVRPLAPPSDLRARAGHDRVTLFWSDPDEALITGWQYRQQPAGSAWGSWTAVPGSGASTTRHTVPNLTRGQTYGFQARAMIGSVAGEASATVSATPNHLVAHAYNGAAELRWTDPGGLARSEYIVRWEYQVKAGEGAWSGWRAAGSGAGARSQMVPDLTNGALHRFQVQGIGMRNGVQGSVLLWEAEATPSSAWPAPNNTPGTLSLTESNPPRVGVEMTATLTDPDKPQLKYAIWTWDRKGSASGAGDPSASIDQGPRYTPGKLDQGFGILVTVTYTDDHGEETARHTTPAVAANQPPTLREVSRRAVPENGQDLKAGIYEATDPEVGAIAWSAPGGPDSSSFALAEVAGQPQQRALRFKAAPDFETQALYRVALEVSDPAGQSAKMEGIEVTVANANEPGAITLSPDPPRACAELTATLADEDGEITFDLSQKPKDFTYGWSFAQAGGAEAPVSVNHTHTPSNSDVGHALRVTARYGDAASKRNTATRQSAAVQASPPGPPVGLQATRGEEQIALGWTPPDHCGSAITGYAYRYRVAPKGSWSQPDTTTAASQTVTGLEPATTYEFEVRAHNGEGSSPAAGLVVSTTGNQAPVVSGPSPVEVAEGSNRFAAEYTVTDADLPGDTIAWSRAGADSAHFELKAGSTAHKRKLHFAADPDHETRDRYTLAVKVTDAAGAQPPDPGDRDREQRERGRRDHPESGSPSGLRRADGHPGRRGRRDHLRPVEEAEGLHLRLVLYATPVGRRGRGRRRRAPVSVDRTYTPSDTAMWAMPCR